MRFQLDPDDDLPLHAQLARQLRLAITAGTLTAEQQLPSVRTLVSLLGVNHQTVLRAYSALESEGLIDRRQGQGTFVIPEALAEARERRRREVLEQMRQLAAIARELSISAEELLAAITPPEATPLSAGYATPDRPVLVSDGGLAADEEGGRDIS